MVSILHYTQESRKSKLFAFLGVMEYNLTACMKTSKTKIVEETKKLEDVLKYLDSIQEERTKKDHGNDRTKSASI
jgi:hypothetical protein